VADIGLHLGLAIAMIALGVLLGRPVRTTDTAARLSATQPGRGEPLRKMRKLVMQEMRVVAIGVDPRVDAPVLLLQEVAARHRVLPVWVGPAEADAIERERQHLTTPRPTTHQLIGQVISSCGHRLQRVCVTMVRDGVFHAELVIGPDVRVSARVSDAVALALQMGVPVHAADVVLDQAALDDVQVIDVHAAEAEGGPPSARPADRDAELEEFRQFLDHTTPEDFGTD
jgi:hypothetical protein